MEAVILCGIQASGKTSFYRERFFDSHVRISLDVLKTRHREKILRRACIEAQQPFVVDNTNPTRRERRLYLEPARAAGFRVVGYWFDIPAREAITRNHRRPPSERILVVGILATYGRLEVPRVDEGFDALFRVRPAPEAGFRVEEMGGAGPAARKPTAPRLFDSPP